MYRTRLLLSFSLTLLFLVPLSGLYSALVRLIGYVDPREALRAEIRRALNNG